MTTDPTERVEDSIERTTHITRAYDSIAPDRDEAIVRILADLQHGRTRAEFHALLDQSRGIWFREAVAAGGTGLSFAESWPSREMIWRHLLERERIAGDHWLYWPEQIKEDTVAACVQAEAEAIRERLALVEEREGFTATWDPQTGAMTDPVTFADAVVFDPDKRKEILADACLAVIDRFPAIEDEQIALLIDDATADLAALGYTCEVTRHAGTTLDSLFVTPRRRSVRLNLVVEGPLSPRVPQHAATIADFARVAAELPPLQVDRDSTDWFHPDFDAQARRVADTRLLDPQDYRTLLAGLADARTAEVNEALANTSHVWHPQLATAVPIPGYRPRPLNAEQLAAVAAAKDRVDPAEVYRAVLGRAPEPVAAAFPDTVPQHTDVAAETPPEEALMHKNQPAWEPR